MNAPGQGERGTHRIAVLASGAGSTFASLLDARAAGALDVDVGLLIASRSDVGALTIASSRDVSHVTLDEKAMGHEAVDDAMRAVLAAHQIDLLVLAGYTRKVGPLTLVAYRDRILNTHPAPLPRFGGKGMYGERVHRAVLESGVRESAATVHLVDAEYDTGPVIAAQPVPIDDGDDVVALRTRVQAAERALLIRTLNAWAAKTIRLDRLGASDIDAVCSWRYDGAYASYDLAMSDRSSFDDPGSEYLAIRRGVELIGFVCLGAEARVTGMTEDSAVLDIGIGIRPDLTGRGESRRLMPAILWALDRHTDHVTLQAVVKAWNRRAQRAAAHGGFKVTGTHENERGSWVLLIRRPQRAV